MFAIETMYANRLAFRLPATKQVLVRKEMFRILRKDFRNEHDFIRCATNNLESDQN